VKVRVSGKADRAEGLPRLRDTDTSLITFRDKQLSPAQTSLLPTKNSRYSKQEERRRSFTAQRGCVFWPRRPQKEHAPRPSPAARGLGPACHASRLGAEEAKPPRVVHTTAQRVQVTLHFCPDQRAKEAGSHAGGMQPRQVDALLRLPTRPAWRPRPTCHATGAPDTSCRQLHRHLRHHRASSIAEPIPRLEATQRTTQQRQPGAAVNAAKSGPAVMTVTGGRE
jgi:hypothetical protein